MKSPLVDTAAVLGVGLIGGSFGMALKERGLACRVIGVGRNVERLKLAADLGAVDEWTTDIAAGVRNAGLLYVAAPVGTEVALIADTYLHAGPDCVITEAGSTKEEICRSVEALPGIGGRFIGGHPMAGSEATGVDAARGDLFENAAYVLTPTNNTGPAALELMRALVLDIGARLIEMDPGAHDRCAAAVSHMPHVIAAAIVYLVDAWSQEDPRTAELAAGSFRDMTRVAASSPELWRDICVTNAARIEETMPAFWGFAGNGLSFLKEGDGEGFLRWFKEAGRLRASILNRGNKA